MVASSLHVKFLLLLGRWIGVCSSPSTSAQVSQVLLRLSTESRSANTFVRLFPNEPGFDTVGTLLAAICWLLLDALESRGTSRFSVEAIVAS